MCHSCLSRAFDSVSVTLLERAGKLECSISFSHGMVLKPWRHGFCGTPCCQELMLCMVQYLALPGTELRFSSSRPRPNHQSNIYVLVKEIWILRRQKTLNFHNTHLYQDQDRMTQVPLVRIAMRHFYAVNCSNFVLNIILFLVYSVF